MLTGSWMRKGLALTHWSLTRSTSERWLVVGGENLIFWPQMCTASWLLILRNICSLRQLHQVVRGDLPQPQGVLKRKSMSRLGEWRQYCIRFNDASWNVCITLSTHTRKLLNPHGSGRPATFRGRPKKKKLDVAAGFRAQVYTDPKWKSHTKLKQLSWVFRFRGPCYQGVCPRHSTGM